MRMKALSIRGILLLTVSALTIIITLLVAKEVYENWRQLEKIQSLKEAVDVSDKLFAATEKFADERDIAYTILHAADAETREELRQRLMDSRQAADAAFSSSMAALRAYQFAELTTLGERIETELFVIRDIRREIDEAVAKSPYHTDKALSDHWFAESTSLIVQTQDLWVGFSKHFAEIDPIVTLHLRYKHFLRIISDYTGRQRAIIGRLIVENSDPTPEEFAELLKGQGIIELSWKFAHVLADQSNLYASVAPSYSDAASHYETLYGMVHDMFYISRTRHGAPSPMSVEMWFELSSQAKESFDAFKAASLHEIHRYVDRLELKVQRAIALHSFLLLLTLGLCLYAFRMITRRVIRPINIMVAALLDATQGKPTGLLPAIANREDEIGKLSQVLHAFQENVDRYRALVEASSQIVFTWKPGDERGMDAISAWWEKTTGLPAAELLPFGWTTTVHPDDREEAQNKWTRVSATGENYEMEYRIRALDGQYLWVYVRGVGLKHEDGSVRELVGALTDITPRKKAQEDLASYTRALERSNKELDDFAYIASHDLKEPLRGLFNHATFLLEDYRDKLDEDGVRKLHRLSYLSQRMEKLVNDLLYFSRLGRQEMAIEPANMNEVIHDIENTLDVFLEERHAKITIPIPLPTVTCDKTRITEVFRNLITNAVKYNDKPEKTVEIGFLDSHPHPDGTRAKNVFYVRDNGKGIPAEFYEEVFRIFKRLQSAKDTPEEGTGAGLTFVKKIIDRHGGKVWPESQMGKGTSFYFTLGA